MDKAGTPVGVPAWFLEGGIKASNVIGRLFK